MKRRIKQNVYDNWNGYEGVRKVKEFGLDEKAAQLWLADPERFEREHQEDLAQVATVRVHKKLLTLRNSSYYVGDPAKDIRPWVCSRKVTQLLRNAINPRPERVTLAMATANFDGAWEFQFHLWKSNDPTYVDMLLGYAPPGDLSLPRTWHIVFTALQQWITDEFNLQFDKTVTLWVSIEAEDNQ